MSHKATLFASLAAMVVAAAGCVHESAYEMDDQYPGMQGAPQQQNPPVSTYPIPPTDPKGTAYVMSLGPERLATANGAQSLFLHARVAVENNSDDQTWTVDPNDEVAGFGNGAAVAPSFAQASTGGPVLNVGKGSRGHMDVYYALPPQGEPPRVALSWKVHRGADVVAQTTSFERASAPGDSAYAYYRPYGPDVHLAVGLDWWWWPWGYWGWGYGWPYWPRAYWAYPFWGRYPYYGGYRGYGYGGYGYRGYSGYGGYGGYGGHWVAPPVGGNWRGNGGAAPVPYGGGHGYGGGSSGASKSGWRGGGRR